MVEETGLRPADFVAPLFVIDGKASPEPIGSMPGVRRMSIGDVVKSRIGELESENSAIIEYIQTGR
jgi:porphobilinogen synthase